MSERVERALPFQGDEEFFVAGLKRAEHGVGELAVDLHVLFPREGVAGGVVGGTGVAEAVAKNVGEEIGEQFLLFERHGPLGSEEL